MRSTFFSSYVLASSSVIPEEPTGANTTPMDDIQGVEFSTGDLIESQSPSLLVTEDIPKDIIEEPSGTNSSSAWEELQGTELAIQGSDVFRQQPVFINPPPPGVPPFPGAPPAPVPQVVVNEGPDITTTVVLPLLFGKLFGLSLFGLQGLATRFPFKKVNKDSSRPLPSPSYLPNHEEEEEDQYGDCTDHDGSGLQGVCTKDHSCEKLGGQSIFSEECERREKLGRYVCCIHSIHKCGDHITARNTYWQSSHIVKSDSSCSLTVKLGHLFEKKLKESVCQVRLDFISFSVAQPNTETTCDIDSFHVSGAVNKVPVICGDNHEQHMYLTAPSPSAEIEFLFKFGSATANQYHRSWNMFIKMIPCKSKGIVPQDCLQYFSSLTGTVKSFNWKDVAGTTTRQLANQDYKICFRTAMLEHPKAPATALCLTPCTVFFAPTAFSVSQSNTAPEGLAATATSSRSQSLVGNCNNDYVIISGGFNPSVPTSPINALDRYCGEQLNTVFGSSESATVCTKLRSFSLYYKTNADETTTKTVDGPGAFAVTHGNLGFCLSFQQKIV